MTVRALLKTGGSATLAWSGGANIVGRITGKKNFPLVVGYHRVVEDYAYSSQHAINSSLVSTKTMARQLEWIARRYDICSLDELHTRQNTGARKGKPPAAVTFDDGYADVYHNAFPILVKMGLPFAVFVTSDLIGRRETFLHDELYLRLLSLITKSDGGSARLGEILKRVDFPNGIPCGFFSSSDPYVLTRAILGRLRQEEIRTLIGILREYTELSDKAAEGSRVMDWQMLMNMQKAGVLVGCHSKSHAILTKEDEATMLAEVQEGRAVLESRLGVPVRHFAYPDGAFNEATVKAVARAGYHHAYTVCFHRSRVAPELTMPRRMFWERSNINVLGKFSGAIMTCQVNGVFDWRFVSASSHR